MVRHPTLAIRGVLPVIVAVFAVTAGARPASGQTNPGDCLSADEAELAQLVNEYRQQNGLPPVPISRSLSAVAQWHVWDLDVNHPYGGVCNLHSWSAGELWTEVCYTDDHANAAGMWLKPREITDNAYSGTGYEIAASGVSTAAGALRLWQRSPAHDDVILNNGVWEARSPWPAMGVGMRGGYAVVWFGSVTDPQGTIAPCDGAAAVPDAGPAPRAVIANAHPNPFNPRVTITLSVAAETRLALAVYDARGRLQRTLLQEVRGPGDHAVVWDGTTEEGRPAPSGVYLVVLETAQGVSRHRIALLR